MSSSHFRMLKVIISMMTYKVIIIKFNKFVLHDNLD